MQYFFFCYRCNLKKRKSCLFEMLKLVTLLVLCGVIIDVVRSGDELPPEVKQMMQNLHDSCVAETGVAENEIADANTGKFSGSDALKCYIKCFMSSLGMMDDDGNFDSEAYIDLLPPHMQDHGKKVVEACKPTGTGACDIAYNMNVCCYKFDPSKYHLF
uniref:Odorant binding protein n=1 Tax=Paracoccus marginatus TaxID=252483 RepID=A0AA51WCU1_9HEMI|nr:odorant binding protein [Paracoccus marginatus]